MRTVYLLLILLFASPTLKGQGLAVNTDGSTANASSLFEVKSTNRGVLLSRMTTAQRDAILTPATGLIVYNTSTNEFNYYDGSTWQVWNSNWLRNGNNIYNRNFNTGFVGIGTNTPLTRLYVADSPVVFMGPPSIQVSGTLSSGLQGAGIRMLWFSKKAAFRVGEVSGAQWNNDSIGLFSFAAGYDTKAIGIQSFSAGLSNRSYGGSSTTLGQNNEATGDASIAIGSGNLSTGQYALTAGNSNRATGSGSIALGEENFSTGQYAFGAGYRNNATGFASFAFGGYSDAAGPFSIAAGDNGLAQGISSIALGRNTNSYGDYSFTGGNTNTNNGNYTLVYGLNNLTNTSLAVHSFLFGNNNTTNAPYTFTFGNSSRTTGDYAFTSGFNNTVNGNFSFAAGEYNLVNGGRAIAFGSSNQSSGSYSFSGGNSNTNNGLYSFVYGDNNSNSIAGTNSFVFGSGSSTTGSWSLAFGSSAQASTDHSFSFGRNSIASNEYALSFGFNSNATGLHSFSFGSYTQSLGNYSTAIGNGIISKGVGSFAAGMFNETSSSESPFFTSPSDRIFQIGNGSSSALRSNALTILRNGNVGIGILTPVTTLDVNGTVRLVDGTQGIGKVLTSDALGNASWQTPAASTSVWSTNGSNIYNNNTGNVGIGITTPAQPLHVKNTNANIATFDGGASMWITLAENGTPKGYIGSYVSSVSADDVELGTYGGNTTGAVHLTTNNAPRLTVLNGGNIGIGTTAPSQALHVIGNILASGTITPSDIRYKTNIQTIQSPLSKLLQINGVTYFMKRNEFPEWNFDSTLQYGVIAQEVEKLFPEMVTTINEKGYKGVNYTKLIPVLIEGFKEMNNKVDAAEKENKELKEQVLQLIKRIEALEKK